MTDLLTPERVTEREPVKEPAKLWRNKWRAEVNSHSRCMWCGEPATFASEVFFTHCRIYPSREIAESNAAEFLALPGAISATYLGAFPVDAP